MKEGGVIEGHAKVKIRVNGRSTQELGEKEEKQKYEDTEEMI